MFALGFGRPILVLHKNFLLPSDQKNLTFTFQVFEAWIAPWFLPLSYGRELLVSHYWFNTPIWGFEITKNYDDLSSGSLDLHKSSCSTLGDKLVLGHFQHFRTLLFDRNVPICATRFWSGKDLLGKDPFRHWEHYFIWQLCGTTQLMVWNGAMCEVLSLLFLKVSIKTE
jgi:hypothetical protein